MKAKKKRKKLKKRTIFTLFSMFNIFWYTVVALILSYFDHVVPSDLTIAWFAAWTTELAILFGIRIKGDKDDDSDSEEETTNAGDMKDDPMYNGIFPAPQTEEDASKDTTEDL